VFVPLVITTGDDLPSMRFVFLHSGIREHSNIIMHVKIEQRPRFSTGFIHDEVVEGIMLLHDQDTRRSTPVPRTYMGYNQILLTKAIIRTSNVEDIVA
jgi:hypothetical protein